MRTAGQRRAQGRTRRQQGESTAEWQQGSPSLERSLTTTDISGPRRSSQRPPCQCLLMSITAHTHTYAHAGHKVSAHSMRGRRAGRPFVGPGLLRACCRHAGAIRCAAASCSRTESRASPCFAAGRKQAFRLQLGSSACAFAAPKLPRNRKSGNYINPWAAPVRPLQADRNQSSRFMVGKLHENCESMISMISCGMIFTPQKVALQVTGRIAFSNVHV